MTGKKRAAGWWIAVLLLTSCLLPVEAQHTIDDLWIGVTLYRDGSARVVEQRQCTMSSEGTEGYITFMNMGDMEVKDLQVVDDEGTHYVVEDLWDVDRSRSEKTGRCGYHYLSNGVELCWGIGNAGNRRYQISYTLTNLVKGYDDYDGFNHSFYEAANSPAQAAAVDIRMDGDSLTVANARIWGFHFYGHVGFDKGFAGASTKEAMNNGESIILMMQFEKGLFQPAKYVGGSFVETVRKRALEGSDYSDPDSLENIPAFSSLAGGENGTGRLEQSEGYSGGDEMTLRDYIVGFLMLGAIFGWGSLKKKKKQWSNRKKVKTLLGGVSSKEVPYYRSLPLKGQLLRSGSVSLSIQNLLTLSSWSGLGVRYGLQQLYDAFILRMIYKKGITIATELDAKEGTSKMFRIAEPVLPERGTDLLNSYQYAGYVNDAGVEYHLQKLLYDAAGSDHVLQPDELKEFVKQRPLEWRPFANMLNQLTHTEAEDMKQEEAQQVVGFQRYLMDFSLVGERNMEEVGLWKDYLVYASLFGIAKQVRKDMVKVAPDAARLDELVPPQELIDSFSPVTNALAKSILYAHLYETAEEKADRLRREEAERRARQRERSSGRGGFSSFGGGGGHSGGGGSGFR